MTSRFARFAERTRKHDVDLRITFSTSEKEEQDEEDGGYEDEQDGEYDDEEDEEEGVVSWIFICCSIGYKEGLIMVL